MIETILIAWVLLEPLLAPAGGRAAAAFLPKLDLYPIQTSPNDLLLNDTGLQIDMSDINMFMVGS